MRLINYLNESVKIRLINYLASRHLKEAFNGEDNKDNKDMTFFVDFI